MMEACRCRIRLVTYQQAAKILHMSEDTLRRVSPTKLPRYRPGRTTLFDMEDIIAYLRQHKKISADKADKVSQEQRKLIELCADSARSRSRNRRTK